MRILAAGSVPPPANGHRASLLQEVARLRGEGHDVDVLSLDPVAAAHRYMGAPGLPAALEAGLAGRRFDRVVVQLEPGLPVHPRARRAGRAIALMAFAAVLHRLPDVTIRWDRPDDLRGGPGGRPGQALWAAAQRIEVGPAIDTDQLTSLLPDGWDRLRIVPAGAAKPIVEPEVDWGDGAAVSATQVNEVVRRRAAATRQSLQMSPPQGSAAGARVEQWEWLPAPELGVPNFRQLVADGPAHHAAARSMRRLATATLAAAERHGSTRAAAQVARWALSELRAAGRSG
jgi:hypothetical protein